MTVVLGEEAPAWHAGGQRFESAWLHFKNKTSYRQVFWRLARVAFLMPKKLNIIFDAQNDAQKFGVPCGRGCFLRFLMRADSAQPWLFPESPAWAHLAACACPAMRCAPSMR